MARSRTIVLLRHAKSAWGLEVPDRDRPLSKRGRRDAVVVGEHLVGNGIVPDLVLCSTAVRARDTWTRATTGGASASEVVYEEQLYEAVAHELLKLLRKTPSDVRTVLMIGHSPGIPDLVEKLAPRQGKDELWKRMDTKFPTSAMAILSYKGSWSDLAKHGAELVSFDVPRAKKPGK
jgi:phosphohistidine phosphatase